MMEGIECPYGGAQENASREPMLLQRAMVFRCGKTKRIYEIYCTE
jgi:hypothetical protein